MAYNGIGLKEVQSIWTLVFWPMLSAVAGINNKIEEME